MNILKKIINYYISKTNGNFFCIIRNLIENIFYNQKKNLFFENKIFLRRFIDIKKIIYFPDKERTRLYSRGINFRLESLSKMYLLNKIKFFHGDTIVDCGANIGEIKFIFDYHKKKINYVAFEPGRNEFFCLERNINDGKLFNLGLWKTNTVLNLYEKSDTADSSFIKNKIFVGIKKTKVITLDSLDIKKIKLLKIEAEGAEPEVLIGCRNTLKKTQFVTVDCGPERGAQMKKTDKEVIKFLKLNNFYLIAKSKIRDVILFKNIKC